MQISIDAGVPATVNIVLELGATSETVEVSASAQRLSRPTTLPSVPRCKELQINDLPFTRSNVTELIASQPGTQNSDGVRYATINACRRPPSTSRLTESTQDNSTKSNPDAVFNAVQPRTQAIEEMTMITEAEPAPTAPVKGPCRLSSSPSVGSNTFHGGLYETNRNSYFEACAFFNCLQGTGKDRINLNEYGHTRGGRCEKTSCSSSNPSSFSTCLKRSRKRELGLHRRFLANGLFTYNGSSGVKTVNLYQPAAQRTCRLPASAPSHQRRSHSCENLCPDSTTYRQRYRGQPYRDEQRLQPRKLHVGRKGCEQPEVPSRTHRLQSDGKAPCQLRLELSDQRSDSRRSESESTQSCREPEPSWAQRTLKASTASTGPAASSCVR